MSTGAFAILIPITIENRARLFLHCDYYQRRHMAPLPASFQWETPVWRVLVCCAVCCGALIVSHTNDSYFRVVTKFSGMSVRQGLKLQTGGSLVSGIAAAVILLIALLL